MNGKAGKGEQQLAKHEVLAELNTRVHDAAKRFESTDSQQNLWDFTCECGASECRARVTLTLARYEALRAADQPILADGHEPHRPAKARQHSELLRADSEALKAQAQLQQQRARRNRGDA
jgi:hypothetical protein